jgi:hypothetical protein
MEEIRIEYKILIGKLEEKRSLGRLRCRWKDDIKMEVKEIECENMGLICLSEDRDQ